MIATLQVYLFLGLTLVAFGIQVWALIDAATRPRDAFIRAGKRTKPFWVAILAAAAAIGFCSLPPPIGLGMGLLLFNLIALVVAGFYLADVRHAVRGSGRGRGRDGRSGGW